MENNTKPTGIKGADDVFPVMAWNWVSVNPGGLPRMREAGLTVAGFATVAELDAVHAAGMKAVVYDPAIAQLDWRQVQAPDIMPVVDDLLQRIGGHPAAYGIYLKDEPCTDCFEGLGMVAAEIRKRAPHLWPYINLFPDYATPEQLGSSTYADHLEAFMATCHPPIISYDNYSLMDDGSVRPAFWTNLEAVRAASIRHGVPFQNIVLTVAHFNYREVSAADLRFQYYATLAYGGRGIGCFTYFTPPVGNYRMAPVDQFGHRTETWYSLQNVNLQVAKLAPTLNHLRSDRVYHFGTVPAGAAGPADASLVTGAGDAPFLAGEFTHADGSRYVMVVNRDVTRSYYCGLAFRAGIECAGMVSPYTGKTIDFAGEQRWLAPGHGVLLKLRSRA